MYCKNCGNEVNGKFCSNCGAVVENTTTETNEQIDDNKKTTNFFKDMIKGAVEKQKSEIEKLKEYDKQGIPYCPRCHSTSVSAGKKGFGFGKAAVGAALTGGIGLLAGGIGSKKVQLTCMKCGHKFMPKK